MDTDRLMTREIHSPKSSNIHLVRWQFPAIAAERIIIHKIQGSTYDNVVVNLSKKMARQSDSKFLVFMRFEK